MYQRYQPLPISTGAVGVDRCGNIEAYAAPGVVHAQACWQHWPICPQPWPWPQPFQGGWSWGGGGGTGWSGGCGCGGGWGWTTHPMPVGLSQLMLGGAALANWMIASRAAATTKAAA